MSAIFPDGFEDLDAFAAWALATEDERRAKRKSATIDEIRQFYDTVLARIGPVMAHLNRFPLDRMPEKETRLLHLVFALAEVSPAVEFYGSPQVRGGFDTFRMKASRV
jgi:hypothetical protein